MRGPVALSLLLHIAVILLAWIGLPSLNDRVIDTPPVIDVSVITDVSEAPAAMRDPLPQPKEVEKAEPPKPKQQASLPKQPAPPPPPPPAPPAPPKEAVPVPKQPEPKPEPEPKKEPEPKPAAKPEPKPEPEPEPKKTAEPEITPPPKPRKKPTPPPPPDDFASVLKTVENLKSQPKPKTPEKPEKSFDQSIEDALKKHESAEPATPRRQVSSLEPGQKMSMSEIDALRRQIERCWNPPAGAPEAENLVVEVTLLINQDGTVRQAQIVDASRMYKDSYYRAAAESVLRAVKHPMCTPLKLPQDKYDLWRETKLTFNPRELVGR